MSGSWYWDERRGKRRRRRPGLRRTAGRLFQIGVHGFAGVAAIAVSGAIVLALWDTTIGVALTVLGALTWSGLATRRELRSLDATPDSGLPDYSVTPGHAARIESSENVGTLGFGFGGGGDSGGGGGGG